MGSSGVVARVVATGVETLAATTACVECLKISCTFTGRLSCALETYCSVTSFSVSKTPWSGVLLGVSSTGNVDIHVISGSGFTVVVLVEGSAVEALDVATVVELAVERTVDMRTRGFSVCADDDELAV